MNDLPGILRAWEAHEDGHEGLRVLWHGREKQISRSRGPFGGLTEAELEARLARDREELDRWAVLAIVSCLEAALRNDLDWRLSTTRSGDALAASLGALRDQFGHKIPLDEILRCWATVAKVTPALKGTISKLVGHRHWLAHGGYWENRHGRMPTPREARTTTAEYVGAIRLVATDFPGPGALTPTPGALDSPSGSPPSTP